MHLNNIFKQGIMVEAPASLSLSNGPCQGAGDKAVSGELPLRLKLTKALGGRGAIMFWLHIREPVINGKGVACETFEILDGDGVINFCIKRDQSCVQFDWSFGGRVYGINPVLLSGLPGPQWLHFCYSWDAKQGLFDGYLNGTPLRICGTLIPPWEMDSTSSLTLYANKFPLADFRILQQPVRKAELEAIIPPEFFGSLDSCLGAASKGELTDIDRVRGDLLYSSSMENEASLMDWRLEGAGKCTFNDGWLNLSSQRPEGPEGHLVFWCDREFPESFVAEWDIRLRSKYGLCIVFIAATGIHGENIFSPKLKKRDGVFDQYIYSDINSYHMSYYANTPFNPGRITCNMRKNSGFYLVDNGPPGIMPGSTSKHHVTIMKNQQHIQLGVDGRRIINFHDDGVTYGAVLGKGKIGLRQMQWMEAEYRNFRVYALKKQYKCGYETSRHKA